ncbi:DUF2637 domain-containing protein [Streptomyces sp. ADI98-10]|uniref:DUF2637 domain-containing protein n=1 Tax=Streptomyces sp. ADI98-10 TaxID=1522763 RepID=UPI000F557DD7|nr:DUF2637 domain-containing protein [Streptomyces sp. ADI98-10]RPK77938.1 hypothetical protein EES46_34645 [Streptomyces sp. ADI98-10]
MTTMTTEPEALAAAAPGGSTGNATDSADGRSISADGGAGSADGLAGWLDTTDTTDTARPATPEDRPQGSSRLRFWLGLAFLFGGLAVAAIGFWLSFGNLTTAAHTKFGFTPGASSIMFALGVDATIVVCLIGDLMFAAKGRAFWLLRPVAHAFTALTIYLNATAHDLLREAVPHAAMPVVFVVLVEAGRHYLVQEAHLEMGIGRDPIPWHRWLLHPFRTAQIFRTMKAWEMTYTQVRTQRRELAIYQVWLAHREEIEAGLEAGQVGVLDRLPVLLAPHGVPVEKALALPARMRRAEQQRTQKQEREALDLQAEAERHAQELEHQKELEATAAEAERLKAAGELAQLRARVTGQERVALAEADGATAAAELAAQTTLTAARRAATEEDRRRVQEETAVETERTAEAKRKAAEHTRATAEIERKTTEEAARIARAKADEARAKADEATAKADAEEAAREAAARSKATAEDLATAAAIELAAAEKLRTAAETRAAAAHAEALSGLDVVQIKTRVAARVLLADPQADGATLAAALGGASASRTSDYRKAALGLIAQGYPEHDPDLSTTPATGPVSIPGQTEITV